MKKWINQYWVYLLAWASFIYGFVETAVRTKPIEKWEMIVMIVVAVVWSVLTYIHNRRCDKLQEAQEELLEEPRFSK